MMQNAMSMYVNPVFTSFKSQSPSLASSSTSISSINLSEIYIY